MSTTWLYGVRSEIRVCGVASFQAALRLARSLIPRGTLPDGVELEGSVSKRRFLHRIRSLLSKIDGRGVLRGANAAKVTAAQRQMLIKLLIWRCSVKGGMYMLLSVYFHTDFNFFFSTDPSFFRGCLWQPLYCFHFNFRYVTLVRYI